MVDQPIKVRDEAFISEKYEGMWGAIRNYAQLEAQSKDMTLSEIFRRVTLYALHIDAGSAVMPKEGARGDLYVGGVKAQLPAVEVEHILRALGELAVMRAVHVDADVIAELGAGWSANVFGLWLRGAPASAQYFGCELTAGGREAAAVIAATEPRMRFAAPPFNWSDPDYSFIPTTARHVTVFSKYSMEQIPQLKREVFDRLLERTRDAKSVQGVHMEPFGWQYAELSCPEFVEHGRRFANDMRYNLNGRAFFEALEKDGTIRVESLAVDAFGYAPKNLATVIHWSRP